MVVERYSYGLYGDPDTQAFVDTARTNLLVSQDAVDKHAEVFSWSIDYIGTDGLRGDLRADVDGDGMISSWDQLRFAQQQTAWTLINFEQIAANSDEPINGWSTLGQLSRPHPVGMKPTGEPLDAGTVSQPGARDLHKLRGVVQLDNRLGYAGYVWDPFLQMYHVRHRVLNPRLGIWMQPDPIGYAGGWNLHEYAGGDPLRFVDPTGLYFESVGSWLGGYGPVGRFAGEVVGAIGGFAEGAVDSAAGIARGAVKGVVEIALTAYDAGGNLAEVGAFAVGRDYRHQNVSMVMQANETGTLGERLGTGMKQAGHAALAVGTLGASEIALGVVDYAETGDGDALSERMGGVIFQNLTMAAIAKARANKKPVPNAPVKPATSVASADASAAAEATCRSPLPSSHGKLPTIRGRPAINSKYAGRMHPSGIWFTERGFPDFRPVAVAEVEIPGLTGHYGIDAAMANRAVGLKSTPSGYVWHHVEDGLTMQLVPRPIHNAVRHTGGAAVIRNGGLDP